MKIFRFALHFWITLASLLSFGLGWMFLARSPKPIQPVRVSSSSTVALPTLQPLQSLQFDNSGGGNNNTITFQSPTVSVQPFPQALSSSPSFQTGGS
jgi:hypothetical protein